MKHLIAIRDDIGNNCYEPSLYNSLADFKRSVKALPKDNYLTMFPSDYSFSVIANYIHENTENPLEVNAKTDWCKISTIIGEENEK